MWGDMGEMCGDMGRSHLLRHEGVLARAELPPSVLWHFHRRPRVALRLVALAAALAAAAASPVGVGQRLSTSSSPASC